MIAVRSPTRRNDFFITPRTLLPANSKGLEMTSEHYLDQARRMLISICGPAAWDINRKAWLARGARVLGWSYRRTSALFYGEVRRLDQGEYQQLLDHIAALEAATKNRGDLLDQLRSLRLGQDPSDPR